MVDEVQSNAVDLAAELTIAWLGNQNNRVDAEHVPSFLRAMHTTVTDLTNGVPLPEEGGSGVAKDTEYVPAVTVRKSLASKDYILSMIDGKPYKTLRRHLNRHGVTPEDYRRRYNLRADYPMVAENYSEQRRAMAKKIGLGSKGRQTRAEPAATTEAAAKPASRKRAKTADS